MPHMYHLPRVRRNDVSTFIHSVSPPGCMLGFCKLRAQESEKIWLANSFCHGGGGSIVAVIRTFQIRDQSSRDVSLRTTPLVGNSTQGIHFVFKYFCI